MGGVDGGGATGVEGNKSPVECMMPPTTANIARTMRQPIPTVLGLSAGGGVLGGSGERGIGLSP